MKFPSSPMSAFSGDEGPEPPPMHGFVMDDYMETQFQQNLEQRENVSQTISESISNDTFASSSEDDADDPDNSEFDSD